MTFTGSRRFVGLGFGPIQAGLFVYEAQRTGVYAPPLVVDVRADLVAGLRAGAGHFVVNIAHADGIEVAAIGPVSVADSTVEEERAAVVSAIAAADELATALPSIAFYRTQRAVEPEPTPGRCAAAPQRRAAPHHLLCREPPRGGGSARRGRARGAGPGRACHRHRPRALRGHRHRQDERRHRRPCRDRGAGPLDDHADAAAGFPRRGLRPHPRLERRPGRRTGGDPPGHPRAPRGRRPGALRSRQVAGTQRHARPGRFPRHAAGPGPGGGPRAGAGRHGLPAHGVPGRVGPDAPSAVRRERAALHGRRLRGLRRRPPGPHGQPAPRRHRGAGIARSAPQARLGRPAGGPHAARAGRRRADAALCDGRGRRSRDPAARAGCCPPGRRRTGPPPGGTPPRCSGAAGRPTWMPQRRRRSSRPSARAATGWTVGGSAASLRCPRRILRPRRLCPCQAPQPGHRRRHPRLPGSSDAHRGRGGDRPPPAGARRRRWLDGRDSGRGRGSWR